MSMKPVKVSQLNSYIKRVLSGDPILGNISVVGEVSNLKFHSSGHVYFTMKDETSKINCFIGADTAVKLRYEPSEGMEIIAHGYIYLYERGGSYSLNIRDIEIQGSGNLSIAFENLKQKLAKEGLFDEAHKKPLPAFPKRIAVVTSETGAALQDILKIIKTRNNYVDVLIYPVLVQGPEAAQDIAKAIEEINRLFTDIDVMIVGRGGGSMEELWAFNEEIVSRAIYLSEIPIISAVGHEIDFTIADFTADKRAETPTAAAQMAVPDINELRVCILSLKDGMLHNLKRQREYKERLVYNYRSEAMLDILRNKMDIRKLRTESAYKQLCDLSPLNIMERGYAAVMGGDGRLKSSVSDFQSGEIFTAVFKDGRLKAKVISKEGKGHE